jgi:hypothetical protein
VPRRSFEQDETFEPSSQLRTTPYVVPAGVSDPLA